MESVAFLTGELKFVTITLWPMRQAKDRPGARAPSASWQTSCLESSCQLDILHAARPASGWSLP